MECMQAEMAQGTAARGWAGKWREARSAPRALFCIPTYTNPDERDSGGMLRRWKALTYNHYGLWGQHQLYKDLGAWPLGRET